MRVLTPQIALHTGESDKNDPIMSLDCHPEVMVVVTAGTDREVKFWKIDTRDDVMATPLQFLVGIQVHESSVSGVRFSPNGAMLATCGMDSRISILSLAEDAAWDRLSNERDCKRKTLRGHTSDVTDIAWSRDSQYLVSGSIDGQVILWSNDSLKPLQSFDEHGHYVQGVSWDPYQHFFCSESADRTVKLYKQGSQTNSKFEYFVDVSRRLYTVQDSSPVESTENGQPAVPTIKTKSQRILADDTADVFFRRICWSPDGLFLIVPTGQYRNGPRGESSPSTYVYVRGKWNTPALHLPGASKPSVAVTCNRKLFEVLPDGPKPWGQADYRVVFAVATTNAVFIYDTQHTQPIAIAKNLHLAQQTDMSWAADGKTLIVSSSDGYCSLISLDELGQMKDEASYPEICKPYAAAAPCVATPTHAVEETPAAPEVSSPVPAATEAPKVVNTLVARKRITPTPVAEGEQQVEPSANAEAQQIDNKKTIEEPQEPDLKKQCIVSIQT